MSILRPGDAAPSDKAERVREGVHRFPSLPCVLLTIDALVQPRLRSLEHLWEKLSKGAEHDRYLNPIFLAFLFVSNLELNLNMRCQ